MDRKLYEKYLTDAVSTPEKIAEYSTAILEMVDRDAAEAEAAEAAIAEKDNKISELQQSNINLFLQITGQRKEEEEDEDMSLEDFAKQM